jgi:hypothetical protein
MGGKYLTKINHSFAKWDVETLGIEDEQLVVECVGMNSSPYDCSDIQCI